MSIFEYESAQNDKPQAAAGTSSPIRPVDQLVLELLRKEPGLTVTDLTDRLEVTATAVRQRLDRLENCGFIERQKCSTSRGRPVFQYALSPLGLRRVGVDYMEFAVAMWDVVRNYPDKQVRQNLIDAISQKMGGMYKQLLPEGSLAERIFAMVQVLNGRNVPSRVAQLGNLPVIEVQACPFPDLMDDSQNRSICELEQQVFSEAIGQQLELSCCRLDGHNSCQYRSTSP